MRVIPVVLFFALNFGALAIGSLLMGGGPTSEWYQQVPKAPWTPPGWVFGAAWTSIMICYTIYMSIAWQRLKKSKLILVFSAQWLLNVLWNPIFFYFHETIIGLVIITLLTILIWLKAIGFRQKMGAWSLLLLPYSIWLTIATSLNLYIVLYS
jgi:tryptophan-rich sensory protein